MKAESLSSNSEGAMAAQTATTSAFPNLKCSSGKQGEVYIIEPAIFQEIENR